MSASVDQETVETKMRDAAVLRAEDTLSWLDSLAFSHPTRVILPVLA